MAEKKNSPASGRKSEVLSRDWLKRQVLKLTLRLTPALAFSLAMTVSLSGSLCPAGHAQTAETASLRKISVDANRFIVFEYSSGGVKAAPQLFEMPSPDHRLIIDLPSTVVDTATMPSADDLSAEVNRVFPGIRKVRFLTPVKDTPTVRVAFDLAIPAKIKAALRILDGAVSLGLNEEYTQPVTAAAAAPEVAAAPAADAYSQYAKALVAQNPEQPDDQGEWGPRKGSADELKGVVKGFKPLISAAALQTPSIQTDLNATLPAAKKPQASDTVGGGGDVVGETAPASSAKPEVQLRDTTPDVQITSAAAPSPGANSIAEAAEAIEKEASANSEPAQQVAPVQKAAPVQRTAPVAQTANEQSENEVAMAQGETQAASTQPTVEEKTETAAPEATAAADQAAPAETNEGVNNPKIQARRFFNKAVKEHLSGQVAQAIADYKAALAIDAELGDAHSNLGLAYNQQHNYANALSEFRKALAINPSDAITYNGVGAALRAQKDVPGAIKNWETSVKLSPKLAVAHYNLGTAYESQGDLDRAMVSYENATRNDQRLGEAFYRMGLIMMKKHKVEEAKEQFKRALKISENSDYSADARLKLASIGKVK
ncbi:MAG: tetratricopeptide repeat protein [Candidatus Obscuribacterales bacterium]|jgi:tetratricopeptide (TPR) repeat protein